MKPFVQMMTLTVVFFFETVLVALFLIQINKPGREACPQAVPAILMSINAILMVGAGVWALINWREERRQEYELAPSTITMDEVGLE